MKRELCTCLILLVTYAGLNAQTLEDDRQALVALYQSTNGAGWTNKSGWTVPGSPGDNPCGWFGVGCSGSPQRVTSLTPFTNKLTGTIPVEIANLTALTKLDLADNNLTGTIPEEIGNMGTLTSLYLSLNKLSGEIPEELGDLGNLEDLDLSANELTGAIPSSFADLSSLKNLLLSNNHLSGSIPSALTGLSSLVVVQLGYNELSGPIPDFSSLPVLTMLTVNNNKFTLEGMEANKAIGSGFLYSNQASISLAFSGGTFSVNPGGTVANQTFEWYKGALKVATLTGTTSYTPATVDYTKAYSVRITNSLLPGLTLRSVALTPQEALPVRMVSFEARLKGASAYLSWVTVEERNCKGYQIEKSLDGVSYEAIGFRDGAGTTSLRNYYHFEDTNLSTVSYYRIRQIDHDGTFSVSRSEVVRPEHQEFIVYPNPSFKGGEITVELPDNFVRLNVMDSEGNLIYARYPSAEKSRKMNISQLNSGVYLLNLVTLTGKEIRKLIVE